jgi:putative ABC transport system permease protein
MDGLLRDMILAVRALHRAPLLFATAVLTLGVGIGLSTGVIAVAYGVLLRPLPYPDPARLVVLAIRDAGEEAVDDGVPLPEVAEWRARLRSFEQLSGHSTSSFAMRGAGDPRSVRATMVTDGFFDTLISPAASRSTREIGRSARAVALSSGLADELGRDGAWSATGVTIGTGHFSVAAIMASEFTFPSERTDLWLRAEAVPEVRLFDSRDQRRFHLIGRLAPGVTLRQANEDVRRVVRELDAVAGSSRPREASVTLMQDHLRQGARATVLPFVAGAALVLLISCANVSGLLAGRASARRREFAVRRALGGGTVHMVRAALVESGVAALAGWALGMLIAFVLVRIFSSIAAGAIQNLQAVRLDWPVVLASLALAGVVALLSGGLPAFRALRVDAGETLKRSSERIGRSRQGMGRALVAAEIALTVVLLVCAGLLMRTVVGLVSAERGFEARDATAMRLMLTETVTFNAPERSPFVHRLAADVRALPGVVAAGVGSDLPPNGTQLTMTIRMVRENESDVLALNFTAVTPGYLEALGSKIAQGRLFEERDRFASPPPAIITESAARRMFQERDAVGRVWPAGIIGPRGKRERPIIIGVVGDIKYGGLDQVAPATMFVPWDRLAPGGAYLIVRTDGKTEGIAGAMRRTIQQLDPSLPLFTPEPLEEVVSGSIADRRLRLQLAACFAALGLALAAIALWGTIAQSVHDRRHELAVRLAMGATQARAVRLMLRGGLVIIAAGLTLGLGAGAIAARTLRHLLHGVAPLDPLTFTAGAVIVAAVSILACYLPARRAAAVSPAELLRNT